MVPVGEAPGVRPAAIEVLAAEWREVSEGLLAGLHPWGWTDWGEM